MAADMDVQLIGDPARIQAHQPGRGCWCHPLYAIDTRSTYAVNDLRIWLHRNPDDDEDTLQRLRARKGEIMRTEA